MHYAFNYLGFTPPQMSPSNLEEIVFGLFPRKVSVEPEVAAEIVTELRAFWMFLGRQYNLQNAPRMLALLDDSAIPRLQNLLGDPANFGMAKSLIATGNSAGFDMTSQAGLNEFMLAYNSSLLAARDQTRLPLGPLPELVRLDSGGQPRAELRKKRKQKRQAKKRNRR